VLLDVDGTLVDSNDAHARSWVETLAEFGHRVPYERVRALIGEGGDKLLPQAIGVGKETPLGRAIAAKRRERFLRDYVPSLRPQPGARELLAELKRRGFERVVATSAEDEELRPLLAVLGAEDLIDARTSSSDAARSKPDPDIVRAALERSGRRPDEAMMLGDTPYDVAAAARAGVGTIALRCGGWPDERLAGALAIYDDPADLLRHLDRSPLAVEDRPSAQT